MSRFFRFLPLFSLLATVIVAQVAWAQEMVGVSFSNRSHLPAQVFWQNGSEMHHYLDLQPGETRQLQTYLGHYWVMKNGETSRGQAITRPNERITLTSAQRVAPRPSLVDPFQPRPPREEEVEPRQPSRVSSVNQRVVNQARSLLGRRVGNGQCTELAVAALQAAGARPGQGYVWGSSVRGPSELQPGDVLQMFNASFSYPDGRQSWSSGPHTAIVERVEGNVIRVLEQNVAGSPVQEGSYDVRYMTAGTMKYYRPIAAGNDNIGGNHIGGNGTGRGKSTNRNNSGKQANWGIEFGPRGITLEIPGF